MAGIDGFGFEDDVACVRHLVREIGVAAVPGSSFFNEKSLGRNLIRFCFCKRDSTLAAAAEWLGRIKEPR